MGFDLQLLLLLPRVEQVPDAPEGQTVTFWETHGLIAGYVSWPAHDVGLPDPGTHANRCMLSWVLQHLDGMARSKRRLFFAPPLADYTEVPRRPGDYLDPNPYGYMRYHLETKASVRRIILPIFDWAGGGRGYPSSIRVREHNKFLTLPRKRFRKELEYFANRGPFPPPYMWATSGTVAKWLKELERGGNHSAQVQLQRDRRALAIVEGRRRNLASLNRAGCRVLFASDGMNDLRASVFF